MSSILFVDYQTVIPASWLNDVNSVVYSGTFPASTTTLTIPNLVSGTSVSGAGFTAYMASPPAIGGTSANTIKGTTITASTQFSGPGTGLTGTAAGLSIGGNSANITGTLAVGNGGLGITTTPANGAIPIGNGSGYISSTLTAGSGISITNGAGSISLVNSGVTSFSAGTTGLTPNTASTGEISLSGTLAESNGGTGTTIGYNNFKNRIINGAMMIDQRNAGVAQINVSSGAYICDRFSFNTSQNSKWSLQQLPISDLAGYTKAAYVTISTPYTTSAADFALVDHKIEGLNIADLGWGTANAKTVTLSFWVKSNITGTYGVTVLNATANRSYQTTYTVSSSATWQQVTITVPGDTTGTWATDNSTGIWLRFGLGSGSNYAMGTLNTWGTTIGYQPTSGAVISGNAGGYWQITGVQLEKGSTATSFDYRPYGTELALCQRYLPAYNATSASAQFLASSGGMTSTTTGIVTIPFQVFPRVPPTGITVSNVAHFNFSDNITGSPTNAISFNYSSNISCTLALTSASIFTITYRPLSFYSSNASAQILFNGCEL